MERRPLFILLAALIAENGISGTCKALSRVWEMNVAGSPVTVEVALSPQEKTCGLAYRDHLEPDHGMLFVYSKDQYMTFWMKDTRIPLSIAFLDAQGRVINIFQMAPMDSKTLYRSKAPSRYALEMPAGWFEAHKVKAGDLILVDAL